MTIYKAGRRHRASVWKLGVSAFVLAGMFGTGAALAQDSGMMETVVVMGFRQSLEKALDLKKNAADSSDSIMSEDIAKFPDLNLAESLQRIPGIALERQGGEGREISVRGLSPEFTRVRINGMEAMATGGSTAVSGTNRGRAFDFNVFASDLYNAITVHKSASAELEEGSLGATVDLNTAHPFDHEGFVFSTNLQAGYNTLAHSSNPRLAVLVSDTFFGNKLGVLVSGAYSIHNILEEGYSTVRFINDNTAFSSTHASPLVAGCVTVPGATSQCSASQRVRGVVVTSPLIGTDASQVVGTTETAGSLSALPNNYDVVNEAFRPRFARYDLGYNHQKRLGLTGSVQWKPDDNTLLTLDALYADYQMVRTEYYIENNTYANNFSQSALGGAGTPVSLGVGNVLVTDYTVDQRSNTVTKMTSNGSGSRDEGYLTHIDTKFEQVTLKGAHDFSNAFKVNTLFGWTESHNRTPVQVNVTYDYNGGLGAASGGTYNGVVGFKYDFSGGFNKMPGLYWGSAANTDGSVTSLSNWFISQLRERQEYVYNSFRTASGDASYEAFDWLTVKVGIDYKGYGYRTVNTSRSNGTTSNLDYNIPSDIRAASLSTYSKVVSLRNSGAPAGSATTYFAPDIAAWDKAFNIFDTTVYGGTFKQGIEPALGTNGTVHENDLGYWLQLDFNGSFYGLPFRGNFGGRYIQTSTEAIGYSYNAVTKSIVTADVKQSYHNFLPALNMVFEIKDDFLMRINAAQTLSRPGLTQMLPSASVVLSGANRGASVGNPTLKPYTSKNIDLAYEWYYHKGAMLSVALFYKHIDTLVQNISQDIVYHGNPFGLPDSLVAAACGAAYGTACNENLIWTFTTPRNSQGSPLYGTEINWQQPFDFLPGPFGSFGLLANATFVQAKQYYFNANGTVNTYADLTGLSRTAFNTTFYYDDGVFQARVTGAWRSKYIAGINPGNLNDQLVTDSTMNFDFSSSYKLNENLTFSLEGINLTNQVQNQYTDSIGKRPYNMHQTGREVYVGVRYSY